MADPVYVTTGAWGAGGGVPLTAAQVDTNFYRVVQRIETLEDDPPTGPYPTSITLAGTSFTMGLSNGSTLGPITFTIPMPRWRGDWLPFTVYHALDFFKAPSGELGAVLYEHTSELSFDWALEVDTAGDLAYRNISGSATGALSGLSGVVITDPVEGDTLVFDGTNFVNAPYVPISDLDDLGDVVITAPTENDVLVFDGYNFVNAPSVPNLNLDDLGDVDLSFVQPFDSVRYNPDSGSWVNMPDRVLVAVPYHPGTFSSNENFFYYIVTRDCEIPADFEETGGYQSCSGGTVNATGSTVITVSRAAAGDLLDFSETVGTITIAAGHVEGTFATDSGTSQFFGVGDVLRLRAPSSADGTFAGFYATLVFITV